MKENSGVSRKHIRYILTRFESLKRERTSWEDHWRELAENFMPRRSRFFCDQTNRGEEKNPLMSGAGILALRTLANGLQSGLTSPSRPWFSLDFTNKQIGDSHSAKLWLNDTYEKIVEVLRQSNFYEQMQILHMETAGFGTGVMWIAKDPDTVVTFKTLTAGEYYVDSGANSKIDTIYRVVKMKARQIQEMFPDTCPEFITQQARHGNSSEWFSVLHAVEPNPQYKEGSLNKASRKYNSVHILIEGGPECVLECGGYYEFPAICTRWSVTGSDIYGTSPTMDALPDCRELQKAVATAQLATQKEVQPTVAIVQGSLESDLDRRPDGVTYVSSLAAGQSAIQQISNVKANLQAAGVWIQSLEDRIRKHLYNDLFLTVSDVYKGMTATEVAERVSEKMIMLGPTYDRYRSEGFDPLIERVFAIMDRQGMIASPPQELQYEQVNIEFISILAQAQKQTGIQAISQTMAFLGQVAPIFPEVADKINSDEVLENWAEMQGLSPTMIRSDEDVQEIRTMRAQQQQQAQNMAMAQQAATMLKESTPAMRDMQEIAQQA